MLNFKKTILLISFSAFLSACNDSDESASNTDNETIKPIAFPALSMPAKTVTSSRSSYPMNVNIEFIAREFDEPTLLNIAAAFEKANPARQVPVHTPAL